jgi:hydrogenase maturation protease
MSGPSILVAGFGNDLAGDDGVGAAVVEHLRSQPVGVRAESCATDSLTLPGLWRGEREIWIVDAVIRRSAPGTIHRMEHDEVLSLPQRHATVHHLSLPESLRWIHHAYPEMRRVRYRLWGVEPADITLGEGLSEPVESAVPRVSGEIQSLCSTMTFV